MTSASSAPLRPALTDSQIRDFITRVKAQRAGLIEEGVDADELDARLADMQVALAGAADDKAKALDNLEAALIPATNGGVTRDVLNFFNQLFGTGVPLV